MQQQSINKCLEWNEYVDKKFVPRQEGSMYLSKQKIISVDFLINCTSDKIHR